MEFDGLYMTKDHGAGLEIVFYHLLDERGRNLSQRCEQKCR